MKAKHFIPGLMAMALALPAAQGWAAEKQGDEAEATIRSALKTALPDASPDRITQTPVPGVYEVSFGAQIFYVSKDGRYLLAGELHDLKSGENLTDKTLAQSRLSILKKLDPATMIVYPAKGTRKHTVTVFTDIDCPYCRKLHNEMPKYNELGIEVRYLAFPRAGENSHSFEKAVSVWCAENRNQAMDKAKNGEEPAAKKCDSPVGAQLKLAHQLGVSGTPAILLEDGRILPGYMPAERLIQALDKPGG